MENTLLVPFDDESSSYATGFESGQIWENLQECKKIQGRPIHLINVNMIKKMCDFFGVFPIIVELNDDWASLTVENKRIIN